MPQSVGNSENSFLRMTKVSGKYQTKTILVTKHKIKQCFDGLVSREYTLNVSFLVSRKLLQRYFFAFLTWIHRIVKISPLVHPNFSYPGSIFIDNFCHPTREGIG